MEEIDVSNFDTSNVTDCDGMFYSCEKLKKIDVSNFDLSKVNNDAKFMFSNLKSLEVIKTPKKISDSITKIFVGTSKYPYVIKLYDAAGNEYEYFPNDRSVTLYTSKDGGSSSDGSFGNGAGTNPAITPITMVSENGIIHPSAVAFTGKKIKLENIQVEYNGKVYTSDQIKLRYKNAKHAGTATAIIKKIVGDKEATKALKKKSFTFVINPYEVSSNSIDVKTKKDGTIRRVKVNINGKSRSVNKKMWSASGSEITFSGDYTGTVTVK